MIELNQIRDPEDYSIAGRHGFFKFTRHPYSWRIIKLIMYGYDLFDAWQYNDTGLLCYSMIMRGDGLPSGYILFKIGKTRCNRPRKDGFLYCIRESK